MAADLLGKALSTLPPKELARLWTDIQIERRVTSDEAWRLVLEAVALSAESALVRASGAHSER